MKIEEAIKKAYLDGITEAHIMERMEMNFDVNAMADSYTIDLVKKLTIPVVINCEFVNGDKVKYAYGLTFTFIGLDPTNKNNGYFIHPTTNKTDLLPMDRITHYL